VPLQSRSRGAHNSLVDVSLAIRAFDGAASRVSYDADAMAAIAQELYEFHVDAVHGQAGIESLRVVLTAVRELYQFRAPDSFRDGLVVFRALHDADNLVDPDGSIIIENARELDENARGAIIEVLIGGELRVWTGRMTEPADLAADAIVYVFTASADPEESSNGEAIALPEGLRTVPNPVGYASALAPPTFWNLEDALRFYSENLARRSTCKILRTVWAREADMRHLVLVNRPERTMRESLVQHLRSSLRDTRLVRVLEEQNVSETEPVDIEISWTLTNQIALIEVKWLGQCLNQQGDGLVGYIYSDRRAREGVDQLAKYLDEMRERTPGHEVRGYLVVFDARRAGIKSWEPGLVTRGDAWCYADREIEYGNAIPAREDFMPPTRLFLEPRVAA